MQHPSVPRRRLKIIERIVAAGLRRGTAGTRPRAPSLDRRAFLRAYYRGVDEDDLAQRESSDLARVALHHLALGSQRRGREPIVRIFEPRLAEHGFESRNSLVAIVTDDMPFLVDSLGVVFSAAGVAVHLLVHPVLAVRRDRSGRLLSAELAPEGESAAPRESWQLYEIDRQVDASAVERLVERLQATLRDVRLAVTDWLPMRARVRELARGLAAQRPAKPGAEDVAEAQALLEWMEGQHFIFVGYRYYRLQRRRAGDRLVPDRSTGLGILRPRRGSPLRPPRTLKGLQQRAARDPVPLVITKANAISTVHRATQLDYVGVKAFDAQGLVRGEHRFLGLWTSTAYFASPSEIPVLRRKVSRVVGHFGLDPASHDGKAVLAVLETYPRDELFQSSTAELVAMVRSVVNLYERHTTRALARRDAFGRFWSFMVYVPRDRYTTDVRRRIEQILERECGGSGIESQVQISESKHARVHVLVRTPDGAGRDVDLEQIESLVALAATTWTDRLRAALLAAREPEDAVRLAERYARAFPVAYQESVDPVDALEDIAALESLVQGGPALRLNLHRPPGQALSRVYLKFVKLGEPIPISDLLPVMENFGLRVISEQPFAIALAGGPASVQDFEFEHRGGRNVEIERIEQRFVEAFLAVWNGLADNDGFNRLLLPTGLDAREILVLRACCRYLLQTGIPFSQSYMQRVLSANAALAAELVRLFHSQFDPAAGADRTREPRSQRIAAQIARRIESVTSADEDRILRAFLALVRAMLRTNFYRRDPAGAPLPALSFKLDPEKLPDLPLPRPMFEIFVHSTRVEGVHLRKGRVARGGIRWSDRREDFRTEVLGLMKAQNVKNTLIVPVGAKGGFVPRRLGSLNSRDAVQQEGIAAYRDFIGALLDVTDNISSDRIVPPEGVVRRDGDDPYLVVAADKGTASFSDIANAIAVARGFWLGDAFASGGSAGYDHKKMGITARGAWECVKRHFRELGTDIQSQDFTVAGIGDMSGDVFGNGMLLSKHIRLVAAFNHQHVFIDPEPDAARSFAERARLFALPRSSWTDYDRKVLSRGGGIYERSAKSISLSAEAQKRLGIATATATPNDLIRAILRMPVDLLWNGGIGTYVKASTETHADAGDRTNDAVRIDGRELRARVVGEGGNLGCTQRGRVEYALTGGRINTDFIDNSAGVNTSDVEVNLKILMAIEERRGTLKRRDRDRLLASMTDEVAGLVLRNNYLQSQAISTLEQQSARRLPELQHVIRSLERAGELNRKVEYLPDDEEIAERRKRGVGLTRPELSIVLAYSKIVLNEQLLDSDVPEDPWFAAELERYFPAVVRRRLGRAIPRHRLRREIIATTITNSLVNRMGPTFVLRAAEDTGATSERIARAYAIARESFALRAQWAAIEGLDNRIAATAQYAMYHETSRLLRHATYWLLRHRRRALEVAATVRELGPGVAKLTSGIGSLLRGADLERYEKSLAAHRETAVPEALARFMASTEALDSAFDIVEIAAALRRPVEEAAAVYFEAGARIGLDWLRSQIDRLSVDGTWQAIARSGLRDAAQRIQRSIAERVLRTRARGSVEARVESWIRGSGAELAQWQRTLTDMRAAGSADFATLSVGVEAVRKLVD